MKTHRLALENLETRQLLAADSLGDAVEAWVLMNCPNDYMDRSLPDFLRGINHFSATGTDDALDRGAANRLPAEQINQIFANDFQLDVAFH